MADKNCPYAEMVPRVFLFFGVNNIRCTLQEKHFTYFGTRYYPCESDEYRTCSYYMSKIRLVEEERDKILNEIGFGD